MNMWYYQPQYCTPLNQLSRLVLSCYFVFIRLFFSQIGISTSTIKIGVTAQAPWRVQLHYVLQWRGDASSPRGSVARKRVRGEPRSGDVPTSAVGSRESIVLSLIKYHEGG